MKRAITRSMDSTVSGKGPASILFWGVGAAFSLLVAGGVYALAVRTVEDDARQRFIGIARGAQSALAARLANFNELARGMKALFEASERPVHRSKFHRYVKALDIPHQFPAIELMSFAAAVDDRARDDFIDAVRADRRMDAAGYPDFAILPRGRRARYEVLTFVEPMQPAGEQVGLDLAADPARARALELARDTGRISASAATGPMAGPASRHAMEIRLPVYRNGAALDSVAARRAAYLGSVGVGFSAQRLVHAVLAQLDVRGLDLALYAGGAAAAGAGALRIGAADRPLYAAGGGRGPTFEAVLPVDFNGKLWKARFSLPKAELYNRFDRRFPLIALAIGFFVSMLMYVFIFTLYWSRRTAIEQRLVLDTVLDNVDAHVYMKDRERRFLYINARTAAAMGRERREVIGKLDREVLPPAKADANWEQDRHVFEQGAHSAGQYQFTALDGEVRQFWTVKVPLMQGGEVTSVIGLSTDVTELHNLKAQADAANLAKSNFLSNMSHEIRTPMNSIIGMSHLALKSVTNPKQRDYLEKIYHSSQHLLGIIDDILDFSKIEAGKLELEVVDFSLGALMQNVAHQLGEAAASKRLALQFELAPNLPQQLRGDPLRLEQVLLNFTGNAIKFSENGVVQVRARALQESDSDTVVRFEVQDDGIGMTMAEVSELFKSFHQADPSTTRKYGGTGLGLVISKQLAELMGGGVGVDSTFGVGSTFWFTARLGKGVNFMRAGQQPVPQEVLDEIAGACILLVEDNAFSQQVGQELLEEAHATVVVANNGKEAIDLMLRRRFDCVLMDLQMPVMDGFETTRMIRSDPRLRDAVVIAMTANAGLDDQANALAAGMNEFVTKPTSPNLLFEVIARWLRMQPQRPEPPPQSAPAEEAVGMLDMAALAATFGGNPDKMHKYAFMFLESARDGLAELGRALDGGDIGRAAELGHRMKASSRAVGAMEFSQLCHQLEQLRAGGAPADARALQERMLLLREKLAAHMARELGAAAST